LAIGHDLFFVHQLYYKMNIICKKGVTCKKKNKLTLISLWSLGRATSNPFWDSKPELFSDIACLRIQKLTEEVPHVKRKECFNTNKSDVWNRLYHVIRGKSDHVPCIVLFRNFFSGISTSNRRELCLHLNVVPTGAGVLKSRHILLHKYVNRIMITYL
jgi:hypothetical protein